MSVTKYNPPALTRAWQRGELLGKGTHTSVHVATVTEPRHPRFQNFPPVMAVKSSDEPSTRAELERERLIMIEFSDCPNVIRYFGMEISLGPLRLNVFTELATGGTLAKLMRNSDGPLSERVVRRFARSILSAVNCIHERGFVHCDLKPENVLLVQEGDELVAKVAGFGAAEMEGYGLGLQGTLCYFAPESVRFGVQGKEGDIWALGCIVLKMLGGRLPWEGREKVEMWRMIPAFMPIFPAEISKGSADFLRKCLAWNPRDRGTASELLHHPFVQEADEFIHNFIVQEKEEEKEEENDGDGENATIREFWLRRWFNNLFKCLVP